MNNINMNDKEKFETEWIKNTLIKCTEDSIEAVNIYFKDYSMLTEKGIVRYGLVEARIMSKNKERKWLLGHTKRIKFRGAPAIMHILFDITERKKAQSKLKESEEKFRNLSLFRNKFSVSE